MTTSNTALGPRPGRFRAASDQLLGKAVGCLATGLILGSLSEGCLTFISNDALIKQIRLPLSVFVYRVACRNTIVMTHNFVIYFIVIVALGQPPGWIGLLALVGIA